jgi:aspartyl aminopeptidase
MGEYTDDLLEYLNASPTAFHAAKETKRRLLLTGFSELDERSSWRLEKGGLYFVTRQDASVVAFRVGRRDPVENGVRIAAAHTDSPGLRIKVDSENYRNGGLRTSVEVYGGPIMATWFDRELSVAGRVLIGNGGAMSARLFDSGVPCAVIPNLAIHLNRQVNKGVELNAQNEMRAILSVSCAENEVKGYLRRFLARELGVDPEAIGEYDLFLYPAEGARILGDARDMFMSGRIDNLGMCHAVLTALVETQGDDTVFGVLFDSEEIGSMTWQGAHSSFLRDILQRVLLPERSDSESFFRALASSYLVSGDAAHAVHPNYPDKHDESFVPELNKGPVVKINAGQRYTTTAESSSLFIQMCRNLDIPVQKFIGRSDMPSGGTIGPITSSNLGIPSVDIGNPIWGMHSARETAGVKDQEHMIAALRAYLDNGLV